MMNHQKILAYLVKKEIKQIIVVYYRGKYYFRIEFEFKQPYIYIFFFNFVDISIYIDLF